jgi:hypothetical protein
MDAWMVSSKSVSTADGVVASHKPEKRSFGQESLSKRFAVGEQQRRLVLSSILACFIL